MYSTSRTAARRCGAALALLAGAAVTALPREAAWPPYRVTVQDERPVVAEPEVPLDPARRIQYNPSGLGVTVRGEQNQILHLSHFPTLHIDGRVHQQGIGGRVEFFNRPLPQGKGRGSPEGFETSYLFGDLRVRATVTLAPTRPADKAAKRHLDAVILRYTVENHGKVPHRFGLRVYMDVYVVSNDGALFAAPTVPGKVLDGVVLEGKKLPPYLRLLQVPNLKDPGFVAYLTLDLGSRLERPDRLVLTRHGQGFGGWEMQPVPANGDSALGVFWEPREIRPGGKREFAYGYGQGVATPPEGEGRVRLELGGSFQPGKLFDVSAHVTDPVPGQSLTLELPPGVLLLEGRATQPVPGAAGEEPASLVRWRGRVLRPGRFALRVRSSTGVTEGKTVTVAPAGG